MTDYLNPYLNKRVILDRMHRVAANYFGVSQGDLLDSNVRLFLEALAEEIFKIAGEIDNMENRILDKLSSMLIFDLDTIARPSHAVLHAATSEKRFQITTGTEFYHGSSYADDTRLSFYPVCNTHIYKGDISYFIHKGLFYSVDKQQSKTLLTRGGQKESFTDNSFWIGLELDESIKNIKDLSFYIDFNGVYNKEKYLNQLAYSTWKIQEQVISMHRGIASVDEVYDHDTLELFSRYDFSNNINDTIKNKYEPHYLSVKGDLDISDKWESFPNKLKQSFSENFIEGFTKPLLWIEINCPLEFTSEIITSIQVCINSFPVVNKKLVTRTVGLSPSSPIIPLWTDNNESFVSVSALMDSKGKEYYDIPVNDVESSRYGIYSLRRGGCERYSIREAREYLINTIASLEGEISAFFESRKSVKTELKKIQSEVNQIIKGLSNTVSMSKERYDIENYILLGSDIATDELFFVEYWITLSAAAMNLKSGTLLKSEPGLPISPASVILLSDTKEGRNVPQQTQKYNQYRKSLTRHRQLVTNKDIESFCMKEFSDSISKIQVRKGLIEDSDSKIGFLRTTDVYLKPHKNLENYLGEQDAAYFEQILIQNSPATFRYRVFINETLPN